MDYEKKYKDALSRASKLRVQNPFDTVSQMMEHVFPELKESEDGRIKKMIMNHLTQERGSLSNEEVAEAIAWLEKQGEQEKSQVYETEDGEIITYSETDGYKIVEPKFKVGDWITDGYVGGQITSIEDSYPCYKIVDFIGGINTSIPFTLQDNYHLWTIQDAKDGDVLTGSKMDVILMFRGIGNTEWDDVIDYHCYYDCYRKDFIVQEDIEYWGNTENYQLKPATKEQRELLFQKMREAGYMWDSESNQLLSMKAEPSVKQKSACIEKQNVTTSNEDIEKMRNATIQACQYMVDNFENSTKQYEDAIAWLKTQESVGEIVSRCKTSWYNEGKIQGQIEGLSDEEKYQQGWHDALEKQCEQKFADKVKPRFKVGDKVYALRNKFECTIESIDETTYYGDTTNFDIKDQDNWKLVEQKLTDKIEPKFNVGDTIKITGINNGYTGFSILNTEDSYYYNWKLVENKPTWSEEDEKMVKEIIAAIDTLYYHGMVNWLKSLKDRVQSQPKSTWNERDDDDAWMNDIISKVENNLQLNKAEIDWLKSLKEKIIK